MTPKQLAVKDLCTLALARLDAAISSADDKGRSGLPLSLLKKVRDEVVAMSEALDPQVFSPGFGRALLDWPDEGSDLIDFLIEVKYRYDRLSRGAI
jgi:hypothetical protein